MREVYWHWTKVSLSLARIWFWNVAHNMIAHPLIPLIPSALSDPFHDWTADRWKKARSAHFHYTLLDRYEDF